MTSFTSKRSPRQPSQNRPLAYHDSYDCPICRHGRISGLPLMEAMACDFCRHIFTANLQDGVLRVEDSAQPLSWRWTGRAWRPVRHSSEALSPAIALVGALLAIVPSLLVWTAQYLFPPLPDSQWAWFGPAWLGLTAASHALLVGWIVFEHYQFPFYVSWKLRLQDLLDR